MFLAISPTVKVNRSHVVEVRLFQDLDIYSLTEINSDSGYMFRCTRDGRDYVFTSTSTSMLVLFMVDGTIHTVKDTETAEMIYECL